MNKPLEFNEFENGNASIWKQKIQSDLKGENYDTLISQSLEGIDIKPFYSKDDIPKNPFYSPTKDWKMGAKINRFNTNELPALLSNLQSLDTQHVCLGSNSFKEQEFKKNPNIFSEFEGFQIEIQNQKDSSLMDAKFEGEFLFDPINHQLKNGLIFGHKNNPKWQEWNTTFTRLGCLYIDASLYQESGAHILQQLAYGLAHAHEYFGNMDCKEIPKGIWHTSIGSHFFMEIAKLKAIRQLWKLLTETYSIPMELEIHAKPTFRNKAIYGYNNNILRSTMESLSAIAGNADVIYSLPYDFLFKYANSFSTRIAQNQLLILKHEAYLDKVQQLSHGAFYVERLTQQLLDKSLQLFKSIEKNGGLLHQFYKGVLQRKIKESHQKEASLFEQEKTVLVGSNQYQDMSEKLLNQIDFNPFPPISPSKTDVEPIIPKRLAYSLEKQRLDAEKTNNPT